MFPQKLLYLSIYTRHYILKQHYKSLTNTTSYVSCFHTQAVVFIVTVLKFLITILDSVYLVLEGHALPMLWMMFQN